jgi:hypothetical protein
MDKLITDIRTLKKFGITMGSAFLVISAIVFFRHKYNVFPVLTIAAVFFMAQAVTPVLLKPIYIIWMSLASALSWVNTRLILVVVFYLLVTPIGLIMRLFGKDLLSRNIDEDKITYWVKKEPVSASSYERQF